MSISSNIKLSWGDYFTMNSETYNLKSQLIDFLKNFSVNSDKLSPLNFYLCRQADIAIIRNRIELNALLSKDISINSFLIDLQKKINAKYNEIFQNEAKMGQRYRSDSSNQTFSSDLSLSMQINDDLTWPGGVHIPADIHFDPPSSLDTGIDLCPGMSYNGGTYEADSY